MKVQKLQPGFFALILGLAGVLLSAYAMRKTLQLSAIRGSFDFDVLVFLLVTFCIATATTINLAVAWGFLLGRVDQVVGSRSCATIVLNGDVVVVNAKIYYSKNIFDEEHALSNGNHLVLFVCAWRPWSCLIDDYLVAPEGGPRV